MRLVLVYLGLKSDNFGILVADNPLMLYLQLFDRLSLKVSELG